ncbi:hypothetical protein AVEN_195788-1 [Araneus ventricosus]|uniref:Uncharacterized protein n=1 Tax=Araneus ventricosus TaxID=182803 RepID=A0A4Y2JGV3_ARAVE|nr:hypothetical protein AVEN_195788-1 [Araneus ventricosus]
MISSHLSYRPTATLLFHSISSETLSPQRILHFPFHPFLSLSTSPTSFYGDIHSRTFRKPLTVECGRKGRRLPIDLGIYLWVAFWCKHIDPFPRMLVRRNGLKVLCFRNVIESA